MSEPPAHLPQELSWEQMEGGILEKMEALEADKKEDRAPFWLFWGRRALPILIGILCIGTILALYLYPGDHESETTQETAFSPDEVEEDCMPQEEALGQIDNNPKLFILGKSRIAIEDVSTTSLTQPGIPHSIFSTSHLHTSPNENTLAPLDIPADTSSQTSLFVSQLIHSLSSTDLSSPVRDTGILIQQDLPAPPSQIIPMRQKGRLMLLGGGNIWRMGTGTRAPERSAFESGILSYQTQFNYLHPLKHNFTLLLGLQYQRFESRFERVFEIEDYEITLTDTIIKKENNVLTGKVTDVRGDATLTVPAERTVRHYNLTEVLQVPFGLGKTWTSPKWQADLLIGGSVNLLTRHKGRTIYEGELRFYEGRQPGFIDAQWGLNGMMMGRITYRLSPQWGIATGLQFQHSLTNWSKESQTRMHPTLFGLDIGLCYRL